VGLLACDRERFLSDVDAEDRKSERRDEKGVLAGPAAGIEHGSGKSASGGQTHYGRLRLTNIPGRGAVLVRGIPGLSRQPFMAGWLPITKRIVSDGS
jgi:hypothetical protein